MAAAHSIRKGLDLPLAGAPVQQVDDGVTVRQVALLGDDTPGLRPAFAVEPGQRVLRGQLLYEDRKHPGVRYTSPAAGTVSAIHRGERRAFRSIVIDIGEDDGWAEGDVAFDVPPPDDAAALRRLLLESGLWTAFRTRPFSHVPAADAVAQAIFVTAIDTAPHAPDPQVALAGREAEFGAGLAALATLAGDGGAPLLLCVARGSRLAAQAPAGVQVHEFDGPHPAGTPGLHIHRLHPVGHASTVWHIGCQDVAAIGELLASGALGVQRVVSLAGPMVARPRLLRTRLGASVAELTRGELRDGEVRVVSGSVLDGRAVDPAGDPATAFLGRWQRQVSALAEGRERELFGWISPQPDKFSVWSVVAGHFASPSRGLPLTTTTNGGERAMVPIGSYERVMPMDIMATHLLRALIVGDAPQAVELGALELDEEDLALATFVCPGKTEYGPLLRRLLDRVEKEGV
jgi:Na+-transporting NADH:ubiquinone oxidoreductase subunit A